MRLQPFIVFICLTMASLPCVADPNRPRGDVKQLHKVVSAIAAEAMTSWKEDGKWPRQASDFANDHEFTLDQQTLWTGLTHRMHPHPAIDGYVRYQLLSFRLDTESLSSSDLGDLVESLPQIVAQPDGARLKQAAASASTGRSGGALGYFFSGRQIAFVSDLEPIPGAVGFDPTLSVAQAGVVLEVTDAAVQRDDRTITTTIRAGNANLQNLRQIIQRLNGPGIGFRDRVMEDIIPADGGLRVAAMLVDTEQRIRAAEPSFNQAFDRLISEAVKLNEDTSVSRSVQRQLATDARRLNKAYAIVLQRYEARAGQIVPIRKTVRLEPPRVASLLTELR